MWSGWRGTEHFFLAIWLLHQRERWLLIIIRKYHFIHFIIVIILLYYILFDLTLLNKVVYLVLWYRGDEGEPIYRYSHCDHYSDRHKIDKLTCDIKAGLILSFGTLQRFFTLSRYLLIRDFTAIIKSWMVLWSDLYGLSDQIYLADHNWDIPPTRAWIPIQTRKCRIHLSPDICDVLKFILDFAYLAKI